MPAVPSAYLPAQSECDFDRVVRKVDKMRKLIGSGHLAQRPQGMHRRTFEKLSGELDSLVALSTMRLAESLGITVKSEQSLPADGKRSGMAALVMNRRQLPPSGRVKHS